MPRLANRTFLLLSTSLGLLSPPTRGANVIWSSTATDFNADGSWLSGVAPGTSDLATFSGTASPSFQPQLTASTTIGGLVFNSNTTTGYTVTGGSGLSLTLSSNSSGTSSAIYAGNTNLSNSIAVPIILTGSTPFFTGNATLGAEEGSMNLLGAISSIGNVNLTFAGRTTFVLNGNNSYAGTTTFQNLSHVVMGSSQAFGSSTLQIAAPTFLMPNIDLTGAQKITNPITMMGGTLNVNGIFRNEHPVEFSGNVQFTSPGKISASNIVATFSGVISGISSVEFGAGGSGMLNVTGNNTFSSNTVTLSSGRIHVDFIGAPGAVGPLGTGSKIAFAGGTLYYTGPGETITRELSIGASGGTIESSGTGPLVIANLEQTTGSVDLRLAGTNTDANTVQVNLGSNHSLKKSGSGLWILNTASTYTGNTTVSDGTLSVASGATIGLGAGLIMTGGTLDLNSTHQLVGRVDFSATDTGVPTIISTGGGGSLNASSYVFTTDVNAMVGITLAGAGATLEKKGDSTLTLTGQNTYTGSTSILAGTVNTNSIGSIGGGPGPLGAPITVANGTLKLGQYQFTGTLHYTGAGETTDRVIDLTGTAGGGTIDSSGTGPLVLTGNIISSVDGSRALGLAGNNTGANTVSGQIANSSVGTTAVLKSGSGEWTLTGNNTFTGAVTVTGGTLHLGVANTLAGLVDAVVNAQIPGATATLDFGGYSQTLHSVTFGGAGGTSSSASKIDTGAGLLTLGGNVTFDATGQPLGATLSGLVELGGSRTFNIGDSTNATSELSVPAVISGAGYSLTKTGAGTLLLNGNNTYSGGTTINGGTLVPSNNQALGTGNVTVGSSGTLSIPTGLTLPHAIEIRSGGMLSSPGIATFGGLISGSGMLSGRLLIASGGSIAPNVPNSNFAILNVASGSSLTFAPGSTYAWGLSPVINAQPGSHFDVIALLGTASLVTNSVFLVPSFFGSNPAPNQGNAFWLTGHSWNVVTGSNTTVITGNFNIDNSNWSTYGTFITNQTGNDLTLSWVPSAIPEPSTYAACFGLAVLGFGVWRRKSQTN